MARTKKKLVSIETLKGLFTKDTKESMHLSKWMGNDQQIKEDAKNPQILKETTPGFVAANTRD